jgi:acetyl esterase/lipase
MKNLLILGLASLLVVAGVHQAAAAEPIQIPVWPGNAPSETTASPGTMGDTSGNVLRLTDVTAAQLFVYPLKKGTTGPAVLVCPGGAYKILATDLEGSEIAQWLNKLGYVAAVLHYRVPDKRDGALQDAQRALSLLRARAGDFGIDPAKLGLMGFSAGGHLSARVAASDGKRAYAPIDAVDRQSFRPNFLMLIYPAYLLGQDADGLAPEVEPVPDLPPTFLAQTRDDALLCTPTYAKALENKGDPVENHVYASGGHGYGLRAKPEVPASQWSTAAAHWLHRHFPVAK